MPYPGEILGGVYQITKPAIEAADLAKAQEAYRAVFSNAETFNELEYDVDAANAMMTEQGFSDTIDNVQEAIVGGEVVGHVVTVTAKDGNLLIGDVPGTLKDCEVELSEFVIKDHVQIKNWGNSVTEIKIRKKSAADDSWKLVFDLSSCTEKEG